MSGFDVDSLVCGVTATMEDLRTTLGIRDRVAFWGSTLSDLADAMTRKEWCGQHGGLRVSACEICRRLGR